MSECQGKNQKLTAKVEGSQQNIQPRPSKGCRMVGKGCQFTIPLGFGWHNLEGAEILYLFVALLIVVDPFKTTI